MVGILLQPFIPGKAAELLDVLGVDESRRTLQHAVRGVDKDYGWSKIAICKAGKGGWESLFPPLPVED